MWDNIKEAVQTIFYGNGSGATRIDGDGWKVYAVGTNVVRIDLNMDRLEDKEIEDDQILRSNELNKP